MYPQYQFNLGYKDPLLTSPADYAQQLDKDIQTLIEMKQRLISQPAQNNAQPQKPKERDLWEEINKEVSVLTNEQKNILAKDEVYVSIEQELNLMIQQELINSVKYKIAATPKGKELLEKHLSNLKSKKESIIAESNKEIELFKKFQIAVQANPNLTYAEFCKSIK